MTSNTRRIFTLTGVFLSLGMNAIPTGKIYGLSDLYRSTVDGAESVQTKIEERVQVEETKTQSIGAFLPSISGVGTYSKAGAPSRIGAGFNGTTQKMARLTGKETLFTGGSEYAFMAQTNRLLEAKTAEVSDARLRYFVELTTAYYETLLRQSLRSHAIRELELYDNQIGELRSRVKIGRTRASDLLSVQAARAGSEARRMAAENAYLESKLALANLSRIPMDFELREETVTEAPLAPLETYLHDSIGRPSLVAARKQSEASAKAIAVQRGMHFPTLDLTGNYYLLREGFPFDSNWDATLTLTVPIFSGGITQSEVRQAASTLRTNEVATVKLERATEIEIRTLHQTLLASEAELKAFADAVQLATKSYEQTQRDYKFGLVTNLDLLNSLQTLTNAKRSYDQARYQHLLERARLEASAGHLPLAGA